MIVDLKTLTPTSAAAVPAEMAPDTPKRPSPAPRAAVRAENTAIARQGPSAPVIALCDGFLADGARMSMQEWWR